ncbi:hypothetical protein DP806_16555 [Salmonella enterica subsp. enterica serovar Saintpaul]|nr:hypothetical protein [Salmonella enterica subsp. enterica serovar Saintpaul]
MTSHTPEHFFSFPAIRGEQGGRTQYMLSVPMSMLNRILAFDTAGDVMSRSQRELNTTRAKKITRYLTEGYDTQGDYLIPTLVGSIDGEVRFEAVKGDLGTLHIAMDAVIPLLDGQHRSRGIIDFISARRDAPDMITLLLTVGLSVEVRQQFFSDINDNSCKPAAAISRAYNHKDPVSALVRDIAGQVPALTGCVDYEHNVVPAKSDLLVSFKALHDATRKMFGLRAGDPVTAEMQRDAVTLWTAWSVALHWQWLTKYVGPAAYRKKHLGTHGVMVNAIGIATAMMLEHHSAEAIATQLNRDVSPSVLALEPLAHDAWQSICVDAETGTVKCDAAAQNRAAIRLLELFGLDPADPNAWLREACDDSISDERVADMAEKVEKVAAEKKLPAEVLRFDIPLMLARSNGEFISTLSNLRKLRQWAKTQYPDTEPPQS